MDMSAALAAALVATAVGSLGTAIATWSLVVAMGKITKVVGALKDEIASQATSKVKFVGPGGKSQFGKSRQRRRRPYGYPGDADHKTV